MRRKLIFTCAILSVFALVSCNKTEFVENIQAQELVSKDESDFVKKIAYSKLKNVSSTKMTLEQYSYDSKSTVNIHADVDCTFYADNSYSMKGTTKKSYHNIDLDYSEENSIDSYTVFSNNKKIVYTNDKDGVNVRYTNLSSGYDLDLDSVKETLLLFNFNCGPVYKNGNNYSIIGSSVYDNKEGVKWGKDTKEEQNLVRYQTRVDINSQYEVTNYSYIEEQYLNHESSTNIWYTDMTLTSKEVSTISFKYDKKEASVLDTRDELKNSLISSAYLNLKMNGQDLYVESQKLTLTSTNKGHLVVCYNAKEKTGQIADKCVLSVNSSLNYQSDLETLTKDIKYTTYGPQENGLLVTLEDEWYINRLDNTYTPYNTLLIIELDFTVYGSTLDFDNVTVRLV